MKYVAEDGKVFNDPDQCKEYEHRLHEKDDEQEKDYAELMTLRDAYHAAQGKYEEALNAYTKKYKDYVFGSIDDLLRRLFPMN